MDDEVGVAADRRREMAVGGARETGVAEVARVVAGLLQRAQYERREAPPSPAPTCSEYSVTSSLASAASAAASAGERSSGAGGVGTFEVGELRQQQLDRLRLRPLVHAVQRLAAAAGEQCGDALVREDHQLLDEHVCVRLLGPPGARDAAVRPSNSNSISGDLDTKRASGEPTLAQLGRDRFREPFQRLGQIRVSACAAGEDLLGRP